MTDSTSDGLLPTFSVSAELAQLALGVARGTARALDIAVCIAIADAAGNLVAFERMNDAPLMSAQLAQDKAYSVCAFRGLPTDQWWSVLESEGALLHGIVKTDRLIVFGGGVPVRVDGRLVGAVGVSGGSAEQDRAVADAGAKAVGG